MDNPTLASELGPLAAVLDAACSSPALVCDLLTLASEAAVYLLRLSEPAPSPRDAAVKVLDVVDVMHPRVTDYERGLAAGMAFVLSALKRPH